MGVAALSAAFAACKRPCHFKRTYLPTGSVYVDDFNGSHDWRWAHGNWQYTSQASLIVRANELVAQWNASPAAKDMWRYEVVMGPAPKEEM